MMRYFSQSGRYCSFVRKWKVTQAGIGLLEAVKDMYGVVEGKTAGVEQKEMLELQAEIGERIVELVGFDKVKKRAKPDERPEEGVSQEHGGGGEGGWWG